MDGNDIYLAGTTMRLTNIAANLSATKLDAKITTTSANGISSLVNMSLFLITLFLFFVSTTLFKCISRLKE